MAKKRKRRSAAYQPRDANSEQRKANVSPTKKRSKSYSQKKYRETFGQDVQKSGTDTEAETKADFVKENNMFSGQNQLEKTEEADKEQSFQEDYHRRDTYRQSQSKEKYQRKRMQKEHQSRERVKYTTFEDDVGSLFSEDKASGFTVNKKLQKKQKQAQKAGIKAQKARAKLPKKREYTLQRVFDEETGKGKYVVVPIDKPKPFKQESIPKSAMGRLQNESRNFVHGKVTESEKENSAVEGAHKSEQKAEELFAFVKRQHKSKEQRRRAKVAKL